MRMSFAVGRLASVWSARTATALIASNLRDLFLFERAPLDALANYSFAVLPPISGSGARGDAPREAL